MPDDNKDLASLEVSVPRLADDSTDGCPVDVIEVVEYLRLEGEDVESGALEFLRTADVDGSAYWLWTFDTDGGSKCFVTVCRSQRGEVTIGYEEDWYGLTAEQFILGDHHQVF